MSSQNDFFHNLPCIGLVLDTAGTIRAANAYACDRLGYADTADLVGCSIFSLVAAGDRDRWAASLPLSPVEGRTNVVDLDGEVQVLASDGRSFWAKTRCRWITNCDRSDQLLLVWEEIAKCDLKISQKCQNIREIADVLPVCISYVDTQQRYIYTNQTYERWFHLSCEEIQGRHLRDVIGATAYEQVRQYVERVLAGEEVTYEDQIAYFPGGERQIRGILIPDWGDSDRVQGYYALIEDITSQKQAQVHLQQSQQLFQKIADTSPDMIYIFDLPTGCTIYANQQIEGILGYSADRVYELGIQFFPENMHPGDRHNWQAYRDRFSQVADGEVVEREFRLQTITGQTRWLRSREVILQRQRQGEPRQILGIAQNITVHKLVEIQLNQLADSEARLHTILNNTSDGIVIVDQQRKIRFLNPAAQQLFHFSREELWDWELGLPNGDTVVELEIPLPGDNLGENKVRISEVKIAQSSWSGEPAYILSLRDITERRQAEAALQESEERFRQLAEHIEGVFWLFSCRQGEFLYISPAFEKVWQRSQQSIYANAQLWENTIHSSDRQIWDSIWRKNYQGKASSCEYRIVRPNGEIRWILTRSFPVFDQQGQVYRIAGVSEDISDRKQAEEQFRENQRQLILSEQRYRLVSELTSDYSYAIRLWDDGTIALEWITNAFARITGYTPTTFSHVNKFLLVIHPEDRAIVRQRLQILRSGQSDISEYRIIAKNGQIHWMRDYTRPVIDASYYKNPQQRQHIPLLIYGAAQDITAQKQAEESLQRLRHQQELILKAAGEGICGINIKGNITFVNPAAARMLDGDVQDLMGLTLADLLVSEFPDHSDTPGWHATSETVLHPIPNFQPDQFINAIGITEGIFRRRNGSQFPVEYVYNPIYEEGVWLGGVLTFQDITERKAIERMKNEFISIVSHELRTPLTSMRGALGLLTTGKLGDLSQKGYQMVNIALRNTERLTRLINDILDIQRLESRHIQIQTSCFSIRDLLEQAADTMRGMAETAGITLEVEASEELSIHADCDLLQQVLTNLLSNAIKFSEAGTTVWLRSFAMPHENKKAVGEVCFQVEDQGAGIPPKKLETIFEPFQQVDASDSRQKGGTGLGLTICRQIIAAHGGRIWADSTLGEGSTFSFIIPVQADAG
ncbi:PAS domain S-box protein [Geitlerinema sp. PCC 9228]|uniref:PAS domain S-box protein n=1 Tax=Geitlerinema sp. PCC 9228 TaxID=111611 RepID=UPI0008F99F69|nr:PAS domain S-box protein [Geitlerinema sp. PCC 9228]